MVSAGLIILAKAQLSVCITYYVRKSNGKQLIAFYLQEFANFKYQNHLYNYYFHSSLYAEVQILWLVGLRSAARHSQHTRVET